jgi:hypothetical protein
LFQRVIPRGRSRGYAIEVGRGLSSGSVLWFGGCTLERVVECCAGTERDAFASARVAGLVDDRRTATAGDGLSIGCGDMIQTRQNDSAVRVANRQTWIVLGVARDGSAWAKERTASRGQRTVRLPAAYVAEHTQLSYASTAHGIQGSTVLQAHTVVGDAMDAAGVYVGMTRGRNLNRLHLVAGDLDDAREQFVRALERDRADRGLVMATEARARIPARPGNGLGEVASRSAAAGRDQLRSVHGSPQKTGSRLEPLMTSDDAAALLDRQT